MSQLCRPPRLGFLGELAQPREPGPGHRGLLGKIPWAGPGTEASEAWYARPTHQASLRANGLQLAGGGWRAGHASVG